MNKIRIALLIVVFAFAFEKGFAEITTDVYIVDIVKTDVTTCYGDAGGTIEIFASGGNAPYEYSVDGGSTYQTSNFFSGLIAGTYIVKVKDYYNQTAQSFINISQPDPIQIVSETRTHVTGCYGNTNGTITITATGGATETLEYSVDGGSTFQTSNVFNGLGAGVYTVKIRNGNGCIKNGSVITINQPTELKITNVQTQNVTGCYDMRNGIIEITATGGTNPLYYSVTGGASSQTGATFANLNEGSYPIHVKDANGCIVLAETVQLTQPQDITWDNITSNNVRCNGESDGWISLYASGGTGAMEYSISGGGSYTEANFFGDLYADVYDILVKDGNGCIKASNSITITEPDELYINHVEHVNVIGCNGDATGEITIGAFGGTPGYYFSIDGGATFGTENTTVFSNLPSSLYTVFVKDANGCTAQSPEIIEVTQPQIFNIYNVTASNVTTCRGDSTGSISIVAGGGTGNYQFSYNDWETASSSALIENVPAGTFLIRGRDANNCPDTYEEAIEISEPSQVQLTDYLAFDLTCNLSQDGRISITGFGGTGNLYYSVNGGTTYVTYSVLTNLIADEPYELAVKDANGCEVLGDTVTLTQPADIVFDDIVVSDITSCFGETNGAIELTVSGGTEPFRYSINAGADYFETGYFENLPAGNYEVWVKDSHQCLKPGGTVTVKQPDELKITNHGRTHVQGCKGAATGTITINATGGTAPLSFSIDNGATYVENNGFFENLPAGVYIYSVKDINGCTELGSNLEIIQPDTLTVEIALTKDITCHGLKNGRVSIIGHGGSGNPYEFSLDNGATFSSNSQFFDLSSGIYQTAVKDNFNCIRPGPEFTITEPDSLMITNVSYQHILQCFGQSTGKIEITSIGGTDSIYYSIDDGNAFSRDSLFTNLAAGTYKILLEDANLCRTSHPVDIILTQPSELKIKTIDVKSINCHGETNGIIAVTAAGGTGELEYSVDNGATLSESGDFINLSSGEYKIFVKDENGCVKRENSVYVYEPDSLQIARIYVYDESCADFKDGEIQIVTYGGTPPISFSIGNTFVFDDTFHNLEPGTYIPSVHDVNNCLTVHEPVTIGTPENSAIFHANSYVGCSPLSINFQRVDDTNGLTFKWIFGDGTSSVTNEPTHNFVNILDQPAEYLIEAYSKSASGCKDTAFATVTVYPQPKIDFFLLSDTIYYPNTTVNLINLSQPGNENYLWDFGDGTTNSEEVPPAHTYETCADYIIKLGASNTWCSDTVKKALVVVPLYPDMALSMDTTQGCAPVTFQFTNISQNYESAEWNMGDGTDTFSEIPAEYAYDEPDAYTISAVVQGYCNIETTFDTTVYVWQTPIAKFTVEPDSVLPPNQPIRCYNASEFGNTYLWDFGDSTTSVVQEAVHNYLQEGYFDIKLIVTTDKGCQDSMILEDEVFVLPYGRVRFPNAFSPDGDGIFDTFHPGDYGAIRDYEIHIYNRWGERVFTANSPEDEWDGTFRGYSCPPDVYVWMIKVVFQNGTPFEDAGDVTILR